MATTTYHAQLIKYLSNGDQYILNLKNTGDDVSISRSSNGNLPSTVSTAQTLANALGALAFKSSLGKSDVGLGSVDNTADSNKSVKYATSAGSAGSATKATQDSSSQTITSTYIKGLSVSGRTITYTRGDNTTGTITTQDTNTTYSVGTSTYSGTTKLYSTTGSNTDGTMTQKAIKEAVDNKPIIPWNSYKTTLPVYVLGNGGTFIVNNKIFSSYSSKILRNKDKTITGIYDKLTPSVDGVLSIVTNYLHLRSQKNGGVGVSFINPPWFMSTDTLTSVSYDPDNEIICQNYMLLNEDAYTLGSIPYLDEWIYRDEDNNDCRRNGGIISVPLTKGVPVFIYAIIGDSCNDLDGYTFNGDVLMSFNITMTVTS